MSLNLHVPATSEVLRVHPRFATRNRIAGLRGLRRHLADGALTVGMPVSLDGREVVAAGPYLAELETFVGHIKPPAEWASYVWMYHAMGRLHRTLATTAVRLPRPVVATYGPPRSLRRWLALTDHAVVADPEAREIAGWARRLLHLLERQWVPAKCLPCQVVHGDIRLGNVAVGAAQEPVYLDFGFAAVRPTIHDLAYSLPWIVLRPDDSGLPAEFGWERVTELLAAYEEGAGRSVSEHERRALAGYVAAVPLYMAAVAGFTPEPGDTLRGEIPFLRIAEWVLTNSLPTDP
jgi:Ser/Thr protein kinase RdoA (MazF antagonist)